MTKRKARRSVKAMGDDIAALAHRLNSAISEAQNAGLKVRATVNLEAKGEHLARHQVDGPVSSRLIALIEVLKPVGKFAFSPTKGEIEAARSAPPLRGRGVLSPAQIRKMET